MMAAGHMKAANLGVSFGMHLTNALKCGCGWSEGGPGDNWAPRIASAMLRAGRAEAQKLGRQGDVDAALRKLEGMMCPCCGREFGNSGGTGRCTRRLKGPLSPIFTAYDRGCQASAPFPPGKERRSNNSHNRSPHQD